MQASQEQKPIVSNCILEVGRLVACDFFQSKQTVLSDCEPQSQCLAQQLVLDLEGHLNIFWIFHKRSWWDHGNITQTIKHIHCQPALARRSPLLLDIPLRLINGSMCPDQFHLVERAHASCSDPLSLVLLSYFRHKKYHQISLIGWLITYNMAKTWGNFQENAKKQSLCTPWLTNPFSFERRSRYLLSSIPSHVLQEGLLHLPIRKPKSVRGVPQLGLGQPTQRLIPKNIEKWNKDNLLGPHHCAVNRWSLLSFKSWKFRWDTREPTCSAHHLWSFQSPNMGFWKFGSLK